LRFISGEEADYQRQVGEALASATEVENPAAN
jgi:hypothetical protein